VTSVYFDLETGGVEPDHPDIQLAAVAVEDGTWREIETFECKIAFDPSLCTPEALELNGYTEAEWSDAIPENSVAIEFQNFLENHRVLTFKSKRTGRPYTVAKLVGHSAATFDGPRLMAMFKRHNLFLPADPRVRCTLQRAMWWFEEQGVAPPDNYKLSTLCKYFGIPVIDVHDALGDVRMTIALAKFLKEGAK
jgi:DNA polymerase III epsilon subunit-like protein